ncbi:MAG: tetratricopeptide repeat protein [Gemmataceae bacterium]
MAETERMRQLRALLDDDPHDPFLRYGLAMEHISAGDDERAVTTFRELLASAPQYVPTYLMLAQALVRLGREDEAKVVLGTGVGVAGRVGELHAQGELQVMLDSLD